MNTTVLLPVFLRYVVGMISTSGRDWFTEGEKEGKEREYGLIPKNAEKEIEFTNKTIELKKGNHDNWFVQRLEFLNSEFTRLIGDLIECRDKLIQESKRREHLELELKEVIGENQKLLGWVQSLKSEIALLNKKLQEECDKRDQLKLDLEKSREEKRINEACLYTLESLIKEKSEQYERLYKQWEESESARVMLSNRVQQITAQLSNALLQIELLDSKLSEVSSKNEKKTEIIKEKEEQIKRKEIEISSLEKQLSECQKLIRLCQHEINERDKLLEKKVEDIRLLRTNLERYEYELNQWKEIGSYYEKEKKELEMKQSQIINFCNGLLRTIEGLKIERDRLALECKTLKEKNLELIQIIDSWETRTDETEEKCTVVLENKTNDKQIEYEKTDTIEQKLKRVKSEYGNRLIRLGEFLVHCGFIRGEQLDEVLKAQKAVGHPPLGLMLLEKGWINEEILYKALSLLHNIPCVVFDISQIDFDSVRRLGLSFCQNNLVLPLNYPDRSQVVAMVDPQNEGLVNLLRSRLGIQIDPVYTYPTLILEYAELLREKYGIL